MMKPAEKKLFLLGEEAIPKALLTLGIPTMVGMMTSALYNLVDSYFVGRLGTAQVGAVAVVYPLSVIILGLGLLFGAGAGSFVARLLGAGKTRQANECASTALLASVLTAGGVIVLMLLFLSPLLRLLGATDTMLPYARAYAIPFLIGLIFNAFNITVNNIITSEGASFYSMLAMLVGGIVNAFLDPLFIFTFHLEVEGAAIATLLSRTVSTSIFVVYLLRKTGTLRFHPRYVRWEKRMFLEVFKIGVPTMVYQLLCSAALMVTNQLASAFGDAAVAAMGIVNRVMSLYMMMVTGFLKGYQPLIGYNYGAGNRDRMKRATNCVLLWATAFGLLFALGLIVWRGGVIRLFSKDDAQVVAIGAKALLFQAVSSLALGYQLVHSTRYMGLGKAKEGGFIALGRQGIFFIPAIFLMRYAFGLQGILLAQSVADIASFLLVLLLVWREKRKDARDFLQQPAAEKAAPVEEL